jgi:RNA polymerase sigma factor (sigma-70 family)
VPLTGAAAARLYDDHVDAVHALVTRRVGPAASPDIVAEAFEHALRTWDRFDRDRGAERLFLFGAAVAVLRGHSAAEREFLRSLGVRIGLTSVTVVDPLVNGRQSRTPRVVDHSANEDLLGGSEEQTAPSGSALMIALSELSPDDRDIVLLSLWESCPQSAIAETLELSVGTVRSALGRIRRELKTATTADKDRS